MTEQWQELKETIIEMRDNDGTSTQQDVCKFLANYMEVLEKQMQEPCEEDIHREREQAYMLGYEDASKKFRTEPCEDCISREEVQDLISRWLSDYLLDETREALETINYKVGDMPSVKPERPKGKWIYKMQVMNNPYTYKCSVCKGWEKDKTKYCPNCGAEMGGADETN